MPGTLCTLQMLRVDSDGSAGSVPLPVLHGRCSGLPPELDAIVVTGDLQGLSPIPRNGSGPELAGAWVARELTHFSSGGCKIDPTRTGVLLTGGFHADPILKQRGSCGNVDSVWRAFAENYRWVLGVPGARDRFMGRSTVPEPALLGGGNLLAYGVQEVDGLRVAGLGGIVAEAGGPWRLGISDYLARLESLIDEEPDLILLHEAPAGLGGSYTGRAEIRDLLIGRDVQVPVFFGHAFWLRPFLNLDTLQLVNVDSRVLLLTR
jgi:3',5'-cyclic-AMP phosphodiesterase